MTKHWTALAATGNLNLVNEEKRLFQVSIWIDVILPTNKPRRYQPGARLKPRRINMKWQTPAASDFRFGFEITMYIANR